MDGTLFYDRKHDTYIHLGYDEYGTDSPRECGDYKSTFITFERDYISPDKNPFRTWEDMMKFFKTEYTGNRSVDLENLEANALKNGYVLMPVWKYEHSGVCYAAADHNPYCYDGWDSGVCGVIYEKRERRNVEKLREQLISEVKEYDNWINEPCYEVTQYDADGEVLDCIGGIYRDDYKQSDEELAVAVMNDYFGSGYSVDDLEEIDNDFSIEAAIENHRDELEDISRDDEER